MHKEFYPVIITGHRKSGTSVFHRLFDSLNSVIHYPVDISILYAYFPCFTDASCTKRDLRARAILVFRETMGWINKTVSEEIIDVETVTNIFSNSFNDDELLDKAAMIFAVYKSWCEYSGIDISHKPFVFKETTQSIFYSDHKQAFPNLKMISIIRDPRDNYAALKAGVKSYYSKLNEDNLSTLSSLINRARMDLISAHYNAINEPDTFLAVKFEDLLTDTERIMKQVSDFLEIPFSGNMLKPTILGRPYKGNNYEGREFSGISSQNKGNWRKRISEEEAKIIEFWLADVMNLWDYELEFGEGDCQRSFSKFYERYNCKYFYNDGFKN